MGVGPGLTFYFDETQNYYLSVAAGASTLYDEAPDLEPLTQWGLSAEAELGMGWWVSAHGSLGISLVAGATAFDLDRDQVAGSGFHAGARLTFSLN